MSKKEEEMSFGDEMDFGDENTPMSFSPGTYGSTIASTPRAGSPSSADYEGSTSASKEQRYTSPKPDLTVDQLDSAMSAKYPTMTPETRYNLIQYLPEVSRGLIKRGVEPESERFLYDPARRLSDLVTMLPRFAVSDEPRTYPWGTYGGEVGPTAIQPGMGIDEVADKGAWLRSAAFDPATFVPVGAPEKVGGTLWKAGKAYAKQGLKQGLAQGGVQVAEGRPKAAALSVAAGPMLGTPLGLAQQKLKNVAFNTLKDLYDPSGPTSNAASYIQSKVPGLGSTKKALQNDAERALELEEMYAQGVQHVYNPDIDEVMPTAYTSSEYPRVFNDDKLPMMIAKNADALLKDQFYRVQNKMSPAELLRSKTRVGEFYDHLVKLTQAHYSEPLNMKEIEGLMATYADVPAIVQTIKSFLTSSSGMYQAGQRYIEKALKPAQVVPDFVGRTGQAINWLASPEHLTRGAETVRKAAVPSIRFLPSLFSGTDSKGADK